MPRRSGMSLTVDTAATDPSRRRRRYAVAAGAVTSIVSLVGGITVLTFSGDHPVQPGALKPRTAPVPPAPPSAAPAPPSSPGMDFFGGLTTPAPRAAAPAGVAEMYTNPAMFTPAVPAATGPALLPPAQLPALPSVEDLLALLQPLIQPYIDSATQAIAADIARSVTWNAINSALNAAAVTVGDAVLFALYAEYNNGPRVLEGLQAAVAAIVAPPLAAEAATIPDFSGLTAAFAAAAQLPDPLGWVAPPLVALPPLPQLPQLPQLPTAEEVAAGLAALAALAPAGLPQIPQLPELPQLPRVEDVVGGVVGGVIGIVAIGVVLSFFQPPSLTRMLGLPF